MTVGVVGMAGLVMGRQRQACPPCFLARRQTEWGLTPLSSSAALFLLSKDALFL